MKALRWVLVALAVAWTSPAWAVEEPSPGAVSASTLKLPSGPGSVAGLAGAGEVSAFTGQYGYSLPVDLPAGRGGFGPSLALSYNGALGDGVLGIGWGLGVPSIQRSTRFGLPPCSTEEELELVGIGGGGRLVEVTSGPWVHEYRVEGQGHGVRVQRKTQPDTAPDDKREWYVVTTRDGTTYTLDVPLMDPRQPVGERVAVAWYVREIKALSGERAVFDYHESEGYMLLDRVSWTQLSSGGFAYKAEFHYGDRPDVFPNYRTGFRRVLRERLEHLVVWSFEEVRKTYAIAYDPELTLSRIASITVTGVDDEPLPAVHFTYGESEHSAPVAVPVQGTGGWLLGQRGATLQDVDGDGLADISRYRVGERDWRKNYGPDAEGRPTFGAALPLPGGGEWPLDDVRLMDLDGDQQAEMVYSADDTWRVYRLGETGYDFLAEWPGSFGVPLAGSRVAYVDINGDGRTDVLAANGVGLDLRCGYGDSLGLPLRRPGVSEADGHLEIGDADLQFHDVNGDGLPDAVWLADAYLKVYWGRGDATFETQSETYCYPWNWRAGIYPPSQADPDGMGCAVTQPDVFDTSNLRLADLNRDGLLDLVRISAGYVYYYAASNWVAPLPDPDAPTPARPLDELMPFGAPRVLARPSGAAYDDLVTFADLNANGSLDVVWATAYGMWALDLAGPATWAMLVGIDNGLGQETHITYTTTSLSQLAAAADGTPWVAPFPTTMPVPAAITTSVPLDPDHPTLTTATRVQDGFWDTVERRFGGFLGATEEQLGATPETTLVTFTTFERGDGQSRVLRGHPLAVLVADGTGAVFSETVNTNDALAPDDLPDDPLLRVPVVNRSVTTLEEQSCDPEAIKTLQTDFFYDGQGNLLTEHKHGDTANPDDDVFTDTLYVDNSAKWVRFLPCQVTTRDAAGTVYARSQTAYDDHLPVGQACTGDAADGRPRRTDGWLGASCGASDGNRWVTLEETTYDPYGQPTRLLRDGVWRTLSYDAESVFPRLESVSGAAVPLQWEVLRYNATLGLPELLLDPNQTQQEVVYDGLGRPVEVRADHDADGQLETLGTFEYHLTGPRPQVESYVYEDGCAPDQHTVGVFTAGGAPLYDAAETDDGTWRITGHRKRGPRGLTERLAQPYLAAALPTAYPAAPVEQTLSYDATGRVLAQHLPPADPSAPSAHAVQLTRYAPLSVTTQRLGLAPITRVVDGLGRLVHTERTVHEDPEDTTGPGTLEQVDARYDPLGRLVGYTLQPDTTPVAHAFCYDTLGRLLTGEDPDSGWRSYAYDDVGRLLTSENGLGDAISYTYDVAGRLASRRGLSHDTAFDETWSFHYDYDDLAGAGLLTGLFSRQWGRLVRIDGPDGTRRLTYDALGRTDWDERTIGGGLLADIAARIVTRSTTYCPSGKVHSVEVQAGASERLRLESDYDALGQLRWVGYGIEGQALTRPLYESLELTPGGAPSVERFGNGVVTSFARDALDQPLRLTLAHVAGFTGFWDASQHHLADWSALGAAFAVAPRQYDVGLARDVNGFVTGVRDLVRTDLVDHDAGFAYDTAARLVGAQVGGLEFAYAYDGLQNLTQRQVVAGGACPTGMLCGTYVHGGSSGGPRALASVPGQALFTYDRAGRRVLEQRVTGDVAATFDAFDRVRTVEVEGEPVVHHYGPDGARLYTRWGTGHGREEYDFGGGLLFRDGRWELLVGLGGARQAARISVPEDADGTHDVTYPHQGFGPGPVVVTDAAGDVVEERLYEPFGTVLDATPANYVLEPLGWNGKPVDPWTEWSDHGVRWYGTPSAHWLSADPLVRGPDAELAVGEFWRVQPYGFVGGNPVAFWDPDGRVDIDTDIQVLGGHALRNPAVNERVTAYLVAAAEVAADLFLNPSKKIEFIVELGRGLFEGKDPGEALADAAVAVLPVPRALSGAGEKALRRAADVAATLDRRTQRALNWMLRRADDAARKVPNPHGSRGGPAHRDTIERRIDELKAQGYHHEHGGSLPEEVIPTPGGYRTCRRPDITMTAPDGSFYRENVGRSTRSGRPVARERRALDDIEAATGERPGYTAYDR